MDTLFLLQIPNIKGLSYIGYDEALDKLKKNLKREGKPFKNIKNNLIFKKLSFFNYILPNKK